MYFIHPLSEPAYRDFVHPSVNARGEIAATVELLLPPGDVVGVIWGSGGWTPSFEMAADTASFFFGINDGGDAVGVEGVHDAPTEKAMLARGGAVTDLSPYVGLGAWARDINNGGLICGDRLNGPSFVFNSWSMTIVAEIPPLPTSTDVVSYAINEAGDVVGQRGDHHENGYVYSGGVVRDLGPMTQVRDIDDAGHACGAIYRSEFTRWAPARWDRSQTTPAFTEIPLPEGFISGTANAINRTGEVVGAGDAGAFIYSGAVSTDLNKLVQNGAGWYLQSADDINDASQIVGRGLLNGQVRGFLLAPIAA